MAEMTPPAFQFYASDFLGSGKVQRMTMHERGVYITFLCVAWNEGGLSTSLPQLARLAGMPTKRFERMWRDSPLHECFIEVHGRLVNRRQERVRAESSAFREKQAQNGRTGAQKRWHRHSDAIATPLPNDSHTMATGMAKNSSPSPSPVPVSNETGVRARPAPLVSRRRLDAAYEGQRGLYVPQTLHRQFIDLRNVPNAEPELLSFYAAVCDEWSTGSRKAETPDIDMFTFWRARFKERWPPTTSRPVTDEDPQAFRRRQDMERALGVRRG